MAGCSRRVGIAITLLMLAVTLIAGSLRSEAANSLEKLLMPGAVAKAHAKTENNCDACHTPFSKDTQDGLCLDCHKPVKADIDSKRGFHGKNPLMKGASCNLCHDDHKGRDFNMVPLNRTLFDHRLTDFALVGPHADVPCASCHAAGKKFADAPLSCFGCHQADEPHKGNLGKECETCPKLTSLERK